MSTAQTVSRFSLLFCAAMAVFTAIAHLSCIGLGEQCFRAQLAPEFIVKSAIAGTWQAPVATIFISSLFVLCACYALAGAKLIRRLPLQSLALLTLALLCLLRGLAAIPLSIMFWHQTTTFSLVASILWFLVGCGYATGWYTTRCTKV